MLRALRALPLRQREVLVLRYYVDLSEAEIADALGISRGAVKSHASRGMAALRAGLEETRMSTHVRPTTTRSATRLRDALNSEAAMVQPSDDGLQRDPRRHRRARTGPWWRHPAAIAVAAAVVLGMAVGGGAAVLGGDDGGTVVAERLDDRRGTPSDADEHAAATTATSEPEPQRPADDRHAAIPPAATVYVYYVHDDGTARRGSTASIRQRPAATRVTGGALGDARPSQPADPDYYSPWAGNTSDPVATRWPATPPPSTCRSSSQARRRAENAAVQQIVYTVTANDPAVKKVGSWSTARHRRPGTTTGRSPVARAPMARRAGLIWLLSPTEGATVSLAGDDQRLRHGVRGDHQLGGPQGRPTVDMVAEGHTQGGANGEFGDFHDTVDAAAGHLRAARLRVLGQGRQPACTSTPRTSPSSRPAAHPRTPY